jgi:presenilin-like A22 family membrane protease
VYGTEHMLALASGAMDLRLPVVFVIPLTLSYSFLEATTPAALEDEEAATDDEGTEEGVTDDAPVAETADDAPAETGAGGDGAPAEAGVDPDDPESEDPFARDAFFIGLGDAVIPTILVASAAFFQPGGAGLLAVPGVALTVPALGAMAGTLVGLLALMWMVMQGRAHAGLPLLNGGAIGGYLLGALVAGVALVEAIGVAPYV